jgi:hypothetical protein
MTLKYRMFSSDGDALIPGAASIRSRDQAAYTESMETRTVTQTPNCAKILRKIICAKQ